MGNFYSKCTKLLSSSSSKTFALKPYQTLQESVESVIAVEKLDVKIENSPIELDETSPVIFRYKTPFFKASATIKLPPLFTNECYKLGWIQACTQMNFFNTYGDIG